MPPEQPGSQPTRRLAHLVCPENEIRATPIRIVGTSGGLPGFVLPLSKCLVNRDSKLDRVVRGGACSSIDRESPLQGLINLLKAVLAVVWQMGVFNIRL